MSEEYVNELKSVVVMPSNMTMTILELARRIKQCIEREQGGKLHSDNALVVTLCESARMGHEYLEYVKPNGVIKAIHQLRTENEALRAELKAEREEYEGLLAEYEGLQEEISSLKRDMKCGDEFCDEHYERANKAEAELEAEKAKRVEAEDTSEIEKGTGKKKLEWVLDKAEINKLRAGGGK